MRLHHTCNLKLAMSARSNIEDEVATGDKVVTRWTVCGTHSAPIIDQFGTIPQRLSPEGGSCFEEPDFVSAIPDPSMALWAAALSQEVSGMRWQASVGGV